MKKSKSNITLMSFGFKYGIPNANYYFDVGFIKNPARQKKWDFFSQVDEEMWKFVMGQQEAREFIECVLALIRFLSRIDNNNVFAFGCSSGRHRSPIIVEELAKRLLDKDLHIKIYHRESE
jgi:UPF0042 nucleotide-binding protein